MSLTKAYKLRVIPSRTGACMGCDAPVEIKTTPKVCCLACSLKRKRESARKAMERQRRKRGVPEIKGTIVECLRCGCGVVRSRREATKFCEPCRQENARARSRHVMATIAERPAVRAYQRAWQNARRKKDPAWRVSSHMRTLIHRGLKGRKQGRSWRSFVPYTLDELMRHLERQFHSGMSWENHGSAWHIDHIVPLNVFSFASADDPEFRAAWALTNLRPLWAFDNLTKNATRTHLL